MQMRQNQHIRHRQGHKRLLSVLLIGGLVWALIYVKSSVSDYYNGGLIVISIDQRKYIGADFYNDSLGTFKNEGELYFQKNIRNDGSMNCGSCTSGVNYLNNADQISQTIEGAESVIMYDVVLDNPGGVLLETELQVKNSLQFVNGHILGNQSDSSVRVHFLDGATYAGASNDAHIRGHVRKTGSGAFTFPIGNGSKQYPVRIEGNTGSATFQAAYISLTSGNAYFPDGSTFQTSSREGSVKEVHSREYWDVKGNGTTRLTFYWNTDNQLTDLVDDINNLIITGWNGSTWVNLGKNALSGSISAGSLQSDLLLPDDFEAFTFAELDETLFPLEWLSFELQEVNSGLMLEWSTATELGTDKFEIERSGDLSHGFQKIGQTPASGFSNDVKNYVFTDEDINLYTSDPLFYRLKQIDLDGGFSYSKTIEWMGKHAESVFAFSIFPNPAREYMIVDLKMSPLFPTQMELLGLEGKKIWTQSVVSPEQIKVPLNNIPEGVYVVNLKTQGRSASRKIVKK